MGTVDAEPPSQGEVLSWLDSLSNWGRWGTGDRLGTLNHLSDDCRSRALATVRTGETVSLASNIDPDGNDGNPRPPQRLVTASGDPDELASGPMHERMRELGQASERASFVLDELCLAYHGAHLTHIDALTHATWDGSLYNGIPARTATATGAAELDIVELADGIIGRGVLLDAALYRGVDWLQPGDGVSAAELDRIADSQSVELQNGDIALLRTGYGRRRSEDPAGWRPHDGTPGWQASALPWIHRHSIAAIGADTGQEAWPSGYPETPMPIHTVGIVAMGLWLIDNCDLERLALRCRAAKQWEFLFLLSPLRLAGASGSPVNPLAVI